ncbi:MAG: hypothetical protein IPP08_00125 [Chlorobiota bacterium]|jgi:hypothetical protein|nr:hypothetical protein [Chlorobiota bacterium]QQS66621.1 MAG: hypothetical protein IPP08_00125 [Chlorobiota bacterium]
MCKLFSGRDKGRQVFYRRRETQIHSGVDKNSEYQGGNMGKIYWGRI